MNKRTAQFLLPAFLSAAVFLAGPAHAAPMKREIGTAGPFSMHYVPACIEANGKRARDICVPPLAGPAPALVHEERAILLVWLFDYDAAKQELAEALAFEPASTDVLLLAGRLSLSDYLVRGTLPAFAEAKASLESARKLAPDDPDIRATQAYITILESHPEAALAQFDAILARAPDHAFSLQQRAMLQSAAGKIDDAINDYSRAIAAAPEDCADMRLARAELLLKKDNPVAAVADLNAVLDGPIGTETEQALVDRAGVFERLGNDAAAVGDLNSLIDGLPDGSHFALGGAETASFLMRRAMALAHLTREADAVADVRRALMLADKPKLLRLQVFLRRHGFSDVPLDGRPSLDLQHATERCLAQAACGAAAQQGT